MKITIETTKTDSMYCAHCKHLQLVTETNGFYSETYGLCKKDENLDIGSILACDSLKVAEFQFTSLEDVIE